MRGVASERAVPQTHQHVGRTGTWRALGGGDVDQTVAVHVTEGDRVDVVRRIDRRCAERAGAGVQQDRETGRVRNTTDDDIQRSITIEVGDGDAHWIEPGRV